MAYAPTTPYGGNINALREGLEKLRKASLLFIIATLLVGVGIVAFIFGGALSPMLGIAGVAAVFLVGSILALIGLFAFLVPAFSRLKEYDQSRFGTVSTLVKIGYGLGFILFFIAPLVAIAGGYAGLLARSVGAAILSVGGVLILFFIAAIMLFIGTIGVIIGMFKLKDVTGEELFTAAGILFIIGIFVGILTFIGWILVFVGAGGALNKVGRGYAAAPAQPAAPGAPPPA